MYNSFRHFLNLKKLLLCQSIFSFLQLLCEFPLLSDDKNLKENPNKGEFNSHKHGVNGVQSLGLLQRQPASALNQYKMDNRSILPFFVFSVELENQKGEDGKKTNKIPFIQIKENTVTSNFIYSLNFFFDLQDQVHLTSCSFLFQEIYYDSITVLIEKLQ